MKGTDCTQEQLDHAEAFLRNAQTPIPTAGGRVMIVVADLVRLLAWYGAIRAKSGLETPRSLVVMGDE
jgi:hypothetical protein